jgi:hypothetical protein
MSIVIYRTSTDESAEKLHDWCTANNLEIDSYNVDLHEDSATIAGKHSIDATTATLVNTETGHKYAVGVDAILALTEEQIAQVKADLAAKI